MTSSAKIDRHFADYATYQIRLFLFAGNDTTSSTIVYTFHLLSKHPDVLAKTRQEHDLVFGDSPSKAGTLLKERPTLLNQCSYTMAVIKETLRLYPPASTMRSGAPELDSQIDTTIPIIWTISTSRSHTRHAFAIPDYGHTQMTSSQTAFWSIKDTNCTLILWPSVPLSKGPGAA